MRAAGFRSMLLLCAILLACSASVNATELVVNGGFETGDLTGWTTSGLGTVSGTCPGSPRDWNVSNLGTSTGCVDPGNPVSGTYAAYNMFDGTGPLTYRLRQTISLPSAVATATLKWQDALYDEHSTGSQPRVFTINILNGAGTSVLATLYTLSSPGGMAASTGWVSHSVDATAALRSLQGQTVILEFAVFIPEVWTGAAGLGLDAVSLNVAAPSVPAPSLGRSGIALLALAIALLGWFFSRRRMLRA